MATYYLLNGGTHQQQYFTEDGTSINPGSDIQREFQNGKSNVVNVKSLAETPFYSEGGTAAGTGGKGYFSNGSIVYKTQNSNQGGPAIQYGTSSKGTSRAPQTAPTKQPITNSGYAPTPRYGAPPAPSSQYGAGYYKDPGSGTFFQRNANGQMSVVTDPQLYRSLQGGTTPYTSAGYSAVAGSSSSNTTNGILPSTGNKNLDAVQGALAGHLLDTIKSGATVNPNMQITPDLVSKFITQAKSAIAPYYQQALDSEITNINASLKTMADQYQLATEGNSAQFGSDLANERENAGASGTAFSGGRGLNENNLLGGAQRAQRSTASAYTSAAGNLLRAGASVVGRGVPGLKGNSMSFNLPYTLGTNYSLDGARGGTSAGSPLSLDYDPSLYRSGTIGQGYGSDLTGQSNMFLRNYLSSAGNNSMQFINNNGVPTLY